MAVTTKKDLEAVRELRELLTFKTSSFHRIGVACDPKEALPKTEDEVDAFIDERTRLWRESWVFPLLDLLEGKTST